MIASKKRNDDDDQVNKDDDQGRSEEESEEKYQTEISNKYALESDILETGGEYEKDKEELLKKDEKNIEGDEYDLVHTDNDRE